MCLRHDFWKNFKELLVLFCLIFYLPSRAGPRPKVPPEKAKPTWKELLGWSGSIRLAEFSKDNSFENKQGYLISGLWMNLRPANVLGFKIYIDGNVQGQNFTRDQYSIGDLREFYIDRSIGPFDLRFGRQIVPWGRADKVNPTDMWTLRNLNLLVTDSEDQKTGLLTILTALNFQSFRVLSLWQPEWRRPSFPVPPLPPGVTTENLPPEKVKNQYGLKFDYIDGDLEGSISYSHVIDKNPDLSLLVADQNGIQLGFLYSPIEVYGVDFAKTLGPVGTRGECAYTKTSDLQGINPLVKNSQVFCVVGADRTFGSFYINVQYIYKHIYNFQDVSGITDPILQALAIQENILANQFNPEMHGASFRVSHKAFNETLESELSLLIWAKDQNHILSPKMTYSFSDNLRGIVGGEIYSGIPSTFFGRFKDLSRSYLELRYLF